MVKNIKSIYIKKLILICIIISILGFVLPTLILKLLVMKSNNQYMIKRENIYSLYDIIELTDKINKESKYSIVIKNENNIIYEEYVTIEVKINENINLNNLLIEINGTEYLIDSYNKEFKIFVNEGKTKFDIIIKENGENVNEVKQDIYYIKKYDKQFLDEKDQNGTVVHYLNSSWEKYEKTSDLLIFSGVKNIRTTFSWNDIEKIENKYDYNYYDKWTKKIKDNNINIIASFNRITNYSGKDGIINSEGELSHFIKFFNNIKQRYPFIHDYQFINEPNISGYTDADSIKWYVKTIKKLSENTIIGGVADYPTKDEEKSITSNKFYKYLFGEEKNINNIALHMYDGISYDINNLKLKSRIKINNDVFIDYGGFMNLYITEYGVHDTKDYVTVEEQASRLVKQSTEFEKYNCKKIIQYNFWNVGTDPTNAEDNFGLITNDYLPKKSYYSMKNYYQNTNGAEYIGQVSIANGIEAHVYDKDGKPKIIAWATDTNKPINIDYTGFKASDLYGKEIENTNGKLEITTSPVYLDNISNKYFYQAISSAIKTGYTEFNEKFANEINKVPELKTKISNLNTFAESLENVSSIDENIANAKMKEHFNLGNMLINAYNDKKLNIEYVKLSSMLDYLNTIGNAYEDLITVSSKIRITDLTDITKNVNEAKTIIEKYSSIDIVYPKKIYKFSKDLLDTSSYVLGLKEENDIKTGLINSKAIHAKYLAKWSQEFSKIYIRGWLQGKINTVKDSNSKVYNKNEQLSLNTNIKAKYSEFVENLNNVPNQSTSITKDTINSIYNQQYELINTIVDEYNAQRLTTTESEYKTLITELLDITEQYKELFNTYISEDDITNETVENEINKVIDRYNENNDIDMPVCIELINNVKEIYNNKIQTEDASYNYLNKRRIQNTCSLISKILENKIKETAQNESKTIGITYNTNLNTLTNQDVTAQIKLPNNKCSIESNPNNEKYTFTENGTKNITINIRGYKYNYDIKITNIDKTPPQITEIEQDGKYKEGVTPQITDTNLSEVKLTKDGQEVENYKANTSITQEGIYQLKATDKAGNETSINFVIAYPEDEKYKIENNTIKNIKGETSVETLKGKLQVDEKYTIKRKNTEIKNSENIATGDILETESGNKYTLIVRGDLNKDGKVDIKDLVKMRKFLLLDNNLDESEKMAADTNIDGKEISIKDLVKMRIILLTQ